MNHPDESIHSLKVWNAATIPGADIKYIGWLTKTAPSTKKATSAVVEFARPEEANTAIREGLVWEAEQLGCELYDKSCRLKQCFNYYKYGHIGTQCYATQACGYCVEPHPMKECPT